MKEKMSLFVATHFALQTEKSLYCGVFNMFSGYRRVSTDREIATRRGVLSSSEIAAPTKKQLLLTMQGMRP